jgi:chromosome segregation ATPase
MLAQAQSRFFNFLKKSDIPEGAARPKVLSDTDVHPEFRQHLSELGDTLSNLSLLPEIFEKLSNNFSHISSELKQVRERCAYFEQATKEEQARNSIAISESKTMKDEIERLNYSLEREKAARSNENQKNIEQNSMLSDLRLANADLSSRLARVEPLVRELKVTKDVLLSQLEKHEQEKELSLKTISDHSGEITRLREQNSNMLEANNNLNVAKQNLSDRLDQATKDLFNKDKLLNGLREQVATATIKIKREGVVTNALRVENEQLIKEREDNRSQYENQLESARGRYRVTERLLEEARNRYRSDAKLLTAARREKNQLENELMQMNASVAAMKKEIADYRLQLHSGTETITDLNSKLSEEADRRRKAETLSEMGNEENSRLDTSLKSLALKMENNQLHYETTISELREAAEAVRKENERLRSEISLYRLEELDNDADFKTAEDEKSNVVVRLGRN